MWQPEPIYLDLGCALSQIGQISQMIKHRTEKGSVKQVESCPKSIYNVCNLLSRLFKDLNTYCNKIPLKIYLFAMFISPKGVLDIHFPTTTFS